MTYILITLCCIAALWALREVALRVAEHDAHDADGDC